MSHVFIFTSLDAGVLEHGWCDSKDTLLGSGYGRVASSAGYPTAKMVPVGHRTGSNEWVWPGYTHPEHAHHHVFLLPKQVGCLSGGKKCLSLWIGVCDLLWLFSSGIRTMQLSVLYQRSRGWSVTMLVSHTLSRLMFYSFIFAVNIHAIPALIG